MSKPPGPKARERQIIQSYVWALNAPKDHDGRRLSVLERVGPYEVRLIEPPDVALAEAFPFWIELYDALKQVSVDSHGGWDIEEAAAAADHLVELARQLMSEGD
jgi:hypothetical protein